MITYSVKVYPRMFTNDYKTYEMSLTCKKVNIKNLIKEKYGIEVKEVKKVSKDTYIADNFRIEITKRK